MDCKNYPAQIMASNVPDATTTARSWKRRLFPGLAILALCSVAFRPVPSMASERPAAAKISTTTKLVASATHLVVGKKLTLTATVTPLAATGNAVLYIRLSPSKPFEKYLEGPLTHGVAKGTQEIPITGTFGFKVVYLGSSKYVGSTSNIINVTVVK
jgi:uncharacterized protein YjdB